MHYTQLFRTLRETKGLTHEGLARKAACHRNTVINVESGRPVKFKTIAELMSVMGYGSESAELKSVALLWLESISGVNLTSDQSTEEARQKIDRYRATEQEAAQLLADSVIAGHLSVDQIRALLFASERPQVLAIIDSIQGLVGTKVPRPSAARSAEEMEPHFQVAERS